MNLIENIKKRGLQDIANPEKWGVALEHRTIKKNGINVPYDEILSFAEQMTYRKIMCGECLELGKCVHCSCDMPGAMVTPSNKCSDGKWVGYKSPEEWEKYKKTEDINISLI